MASQIVRFTGLSDRDLKKAPSLPKLSGSDRVDLRVRDRDGKEQTVSLPPSAVAPVEALLSRLLSRIGRPLRRASPASRRLI